MRSLLAVVAGYALLAAGIIASTAIAARFLLPEGMTPGRPQRLTFSYLAVNLLCGAGFAALGGFVCAWLAPGSPMIHAGVLAALMAGMAGLMFLEKGGQPVWYKRTLLILGPTMALVGGMVRGVLA